MAYAATILIVVAVAVLASTCAASDDASYVVTDEAWFEVEVMDLEGKGLHYKGRFTMALFGEAAPMTVLNVASIVRGYKRSNVSVDDASFASL